MDELALRPEEQVLLPAVSVTRQKKEGIDAAKDFDLGSFQYQVDEEEAWGQGSRSIAYLDQNTAHSGIMAEENSSPVWEIDDVCLLL